MVVPWIIAEVLQRRDCAWAGLYLIEEYERSSFCMAHAREHLKLRNEVSGIEASVEDRLRLRLLLEIHEYHEIELPEPEFANYVCLSRLPCSVDEERFPILVTLPG